MALTCPERGSNQVLDGGRYRRILWAELIAVGSLADAIERGGKLIAAGTVATTPADAAEFASDDLSL